MKKHHVGVLVEKNAFVDEGDGVVSFPKGLVVTDDTEQRNGTKYDIKSMDLSEYGGQVTADHFDMLDRIIAGVEGVEKVGNKVVVKKINYLVKENPLARLAYNLLLNQKVPTNFSIETYGPWPDDEDRTYYNAKLVGLSQVVVGNNKSATVNAIVQNSIEQAKEDGLDTSDLEKALETEKKFEVKQNHKPDKEEVANNTNDKDVKEMTFVTIKNSRDFAVKVKYKNAAGEDTETEVPAGGSVDVSEDQKQAIETQVNEAKAPEKEKQAETATDKNSIAGMLAEALKPVQDNMAKLEQQLFDSKAKEPEFKKSSNGAPASMSTDLTEFAEMSWQDRHGKQINAAWDLLKRHDSSAAEVLNKINEVNLAGLKKDKLVRNSLTIADFGNFVISPELMSEIQGCRNNYSALVNATDWRETLSTQMAWLKRSGDINMQSVEFCDDGSDGNLKPISEYSATIETANLEELAAVTPVCNAATRFLAADLLGDVAQGYRNDYDRKRAQLVIARLEQAVEANGNSEPYNATTAVDKLTNFVDVWTQIATCTPNGTFVFNTSTYGEIMKQAVAAGVNGPLSSIFLTGEVPTIFGRPFIVVPDDLLPRLGVNETKAFTVNGTTVTVNHAVFYADLSIFTGRTSGGLQYDLSTEAAYEDAGTVKSAYQRNELVLRGSFFRGGAIKDEDQVAALLSAGIS